MVQHKSLLAVRLQNHSADGNTAGTGRGAPQRSMAMESSVPIDTVAHGCLKELLMNMSRAQEDGSKAVGSMYAAAAFFESVNEASAHTTAGSASPASLLPFHAELQSLAARFNAADSLYNALMSASMATSELAQTAGAAHSPLPTQPQRCRPVA